MNLHHHTSDLFAFNETYRRLLTDPAGLKPFVAHATPEALPSDKAPWQRTGIERASLVDTLRRHNAAAPDVLDKLARPETLVVITGQQPGFLWGPLYALYKAWGALAWARKLEALWKCPVVAVFCNMSEDHDWNEANRITVREGHQWVRRALPAEPAGAHLADKLYPSIQEILEVVGPSVHEALGGGDIPGGETWGQAFTRHLRAALPSEPLVILEPSWLRELAAPFLTRLVKERHGFRQDLLMAASALKISGLPAPLEDEDALHLCHADAGRRTRLREAGPGFESGRRMWAHEGELARDLAAHPRDFSCNVVSRVLWMRQLLPVAAEVLGPAEAAYHLQLQGCHARAGLVAPVLLPRPHVTVLRQREEKRLTRLGLKPWQVGSSLPSGDDARLKEAVGDRVEGIRRLWAALEKEVAPYGDLGKRLTRRRAELEKILEWVPGAFEEAAALKDGQGMEAWKALQDWIMPLGEPQERTLSLGVLTELTGPFWEDLRQQADPTVRIPLWVTLDQGEADAHGT